MNECLYYGERLDHSLINPNQLRHFGVEFWDNPYDNRQPMEIVPMEDVSPIPLMTEGTKVFISTRTPTEDELNTLQHVHLTDNAPWNPREINMSGASVYTLATNKIGTRPNKSRVNVQCILIPATPYCFSHTNKYTYDVNDDSDWIYLHDIDPSLTNLDDRLIKQVAQGMQESDYQPERIPARRTFIDRERHRLHTAQSIAEIWNIGLQKAKQTIEASTQNGIRSALMPLTRRYRSDRMYNIKRLRGRFATDIFFASIRSLHGNSCTQIYSHKVGFSVCYPLTHANGEQVGRSLGDFVHDFGAPEHLTYDGAMVQVGTKTLFHQNVRRYNIQTHVSAPRRPNENPGEAAIREVKRRMYRIANKK